jgi:glycolate oxidase FAD binding subunit
MTDEVHRSVEELLGPDAVDWTAGRIPRARPTSPEAVAQIIQRARTHRWRLVIEGSGSWMPADTPADLILSTRALRQPPRIVAADLVATALAGTPFDALRRALAEHGTWLAVDPPGAPARTLGSVVATGTAGALRHRFGPVRDQVLGCTVVTGEGVIVRSGGSVVKNVAGYDLTKLHVGGFGAFGVITECHLRLRALPEADLTLLARSPRDALTRASRALVEANLDLAALELMAPAVTRETEWTVAARLQGTTSGIAAEQSRLAAIAPLEWTALDPAAAQAWWLGAAERMAEGAVSLRFGVLADGVDELLDLLEERLDLGLVSGGSGRGGLRWTGDATAASIVALRRTLAAREIPVTLERGPWPQREAAGHFGAYREGVGRLTHGLRATLDPDHLFQTALDGSLDA